MIKNCEVCGKPLGNVNPRQRFCSECRRTTNIEQTDIRHRTQQHKEKILRDIAFAKASGQDVKSLSDWCREAAECNLDYGTYRTLVEVHGKTFDEIKAQDHSAPCHAHGHHARGKHYD